MAEEAAKGAPPHSDVVVNLGSRLREVRQAAGMSLREVARRLGVSPSFVSQLENGKSQPSVATLYSIAQLLDVSIDQLFAQGPGDRHARKSQPAARPASPPATARSEGAGAGSSGLPGPSDETDTGTISRSQLGSPAEAWGQGSARQRLSVTAPGNRMRLVMDSGVIWEQLARNTGPDLDFMEIIYPAGSSSTNDGRMLRHEGYEYGFLLEGNLEVTVGFDVFTLRAGEALGLDSSVPHLFRNLGDVTARGIWCVHHEPGYGQASGRSH